MVLLLVVYSTIFFVFILNFVAANLVLGDAFGIDIKQTFAIMVVTTIISMKFKNEYDSVNDFIWSKVLEVFVVWLAVCFYVLTFM